MSGVVDRCANSIKRLVEEGIHRMAACTCELCIEFKTRLELTCVVDMQFTGVVVLVHFRGMKCREHIILVSGHISVEGGDDVVPPIDAEVVLWKFTRQIGFLVESIGELPLPVNIVRLGAVCHITIDKEVRGEVGSGEC